MSSPTIVANHELASKMKNAMLSGELKLCWVVHKVCKGFLERRQKRILAITTRAVYLTDFKGRLRRVFQVGVVEGMSYSHLEKPDKSHQTHANYEILIRVKPESGEPALLLALRDDRRNLPKPSTPDAVENIFRSVLGNKPFSVYRDTSPGGLAAAANIKKTAAYISPAQKMEKWKKQKSHPSFRLPVTSQKTDDPLKQSSSFMMSEIPDVEKTYSQSPRDVFQQSMQSVPMVREVPTADSKRPSIDPHERSWASFTSPSMEVPDMERTYSQSPRDFFQQSMQSVPMAREVPTHRRSLDSHERSWASFSSPETSYSAITSDEPAMFTRRNNRIVVTCVPVPLE